MNGEAKQIAIYQFFNSEIAKTVYVLESVTGNNFLVNVLPEYKKHKLYTGKHYIIFEKNRKAEQQKPYTDVFSLGIEKIGTAKCKKGSHKRLTGTYFPFEKFPNRCFGTTNSIGRSDALLFEFTENRQKLTIYVFENAINIADDLFKKWIDGKLCLTLEENRKPVTKENADSLF